MFSLRTPTAPSVFTLGISGFVFLIALARPVHAEVGVNGSATLFWTDDIGIFSATRRLSRDGDPTQPALDTRLADKGASVVVEPQLTVSNSFVNSLGILQVDLLDRDSSFRRMLASTKESFAYKRFKRFHLRRGCDCAIALCRISFSEKTKTDTQAS